LATYLEMQKRQSRGLAPALRRRGDRYKTLLGSRGTNLRREQVLFVFVQRRQISDERVAKIGSIRSRGVGTARFATVPNIAKRGTSRLRSALIRAAKPARRD